MRTRHHRHHRHHRYPRRHRAAALAAVSVLAPVLLASAAAADDRGNAGASCRTEVDGSRVTAYCHNPYPRTDRVQLHVECARWWDVDADSSPVAVAPAAHVELTERCWKEVRAAWVSHQTVPGSGGT
ncbi:hypothetical protein [Streptomyces sp. TRM49041]|uniref:hypothetical protein n=1 Tax=Streptomyces sp. TRM49041 TaxID=2603216 RepID=UPI0011EF7FF2|nr:hypothetical protein [Streptomyces sp. TRM49041]